MALTLSPCIDCYSGKELHYEVIPINYSPVWIASASQGPSEIHNNSRVYFHKGHLSGLLRHTSHVLGRSSEVSERDGFGK